MFPQNYAVLVIGDPGTGMFEFSCYLASTYLKNGERVVFAETDSSPDRVRKQLRRFGVDAVEYEMDGQFIIIDCSPTTIDPGYDPGTRRVRDRADLESIAGNVTDGMRDVGGPPVRVLLDSLTPLYDHNESQEIIEFFSNLCATVRRDGNLTCTIHRGMIHEDQVEAVGDIADGIVEMMMDRQYKRFIRIQRMKGMELKPRWVQFDFERSDDEEGTMLGWGKE